MRFLGTHRIRTTAYHPAANGLVERFHRQLKAALSTAPRTQWIEALPLVLLGIRSSLKEDLHASTSDLVYGTTLRLPGQFFAPSLDKEVIDSASYVSRLRTHMQQVRPTPTSHHARIKPHVSSTLNTCTHVFVRHDALRKALQPTVRWSIQGHPARLQIFYCFGPWTGTDHLAGPTQGRPPRHR